MSLTFADFAGTTRTNNTPATTFVFDLNSIGSMPAANKLWVIAIEYDNAGTAGVDPFSSISDVSGNVWTSQLNAIRNPSATANTGCCLRVFTCNLTTDIPAQAGAITISFGAVSVTVKCAQIASFTSSVGAGLPTYLSGSTATASSTAPSITTASVSSGQGVMGIVGCENPNTIPAGDADTTGGSWSTLQATSVGTGNTGGMLLCQGKIPNVTGTQTYNPGTTTSGNWCAAYIIVAETIIVRPGVLALTMTLYAPTVTGNPGADYLRTADRVMETTTTTGAVLDYVLAGVATVSNIAFGTAFTNGQKFEYCAWDETNGGFEGGEAYYVAATNSIKPITVKYGTNGTSRVSWPSGTRTIACVFPASRGQFPIVIKVLDYNGTIAVPVGTRLIGAAGVAGGGGGGSGRKGASGTQRWGGGGGGGGGYDAVPLLSATSVITTLTYSRGIGGAGGLSQSTNSTDGLDGTSGTSTTVTSNTGGFSLSATGGNGASKGTGTTGSGGSGGGGDYLGGNGGGANITVGGTAGVGGSSAGTPRAGGGGGGGGSIWTTNVADNGGAGGSRSSLYDSAGGGAAGIGAAGGAGGSVPDNVPIGGAGGGGGAGNHAGAGYAGGAGGGAGGGGGGGGASTDSVGNSGAGGAGADGELTVIFL